MLATAMLAASVSPAALAVDWDIEFVDDAFNWMGSSISIAVDDAGVPHIAHGAHRSEIMRYAVRLASGWLVEVVGTYPSGLAASIAIDPDDNPCLAYLSSGSLIFARLSGGTWARETVGPMQFDKKTALCIASDGTPHVAYCNSGDPWSVKHASKVGGTWQISTVDSTRASGNGIAMALDDADIPHVTHWGAPYGGAGPFERRYSTRAGGSWQNHVIDNSGENCNVIHNGIAVDAAGDNHIVYMSNDCYGLSEVKYAVGDDASWNVTIVDGVDSSAGCSLVLDGSGSPHIVYGTRFVGVAGDSELRYAHRDAAGQWVVEVVDTDGDVGEFNSLAIDAQGYLHIAYFRGNGIDQWGELRYARSTRPVGGVLGDMNCDGALNGADIDPFFLALGDPAGYAAQFPNCDINNGDINGDGAVNGADIDPFFECLGSGHCP
jgi:hypothetical protein